MINALEKLFGRFSFIPYRGAKAAQVDPEIFSHLELHIAGHPDIETSCVLANLFRTIYMDSSLFYVESLERLDATSRSLARDLMRARLLKAFPQEEWDEAHRLISQLPPERGGIGHRELSAAAAASAFAEKSGAPSPAIGSLAWAKAWVEYFKWLTRRRAAIAFAFASHHGGFDGFKYLWGAPAAAAVLAAFFGVVLLDERLGFKRMILDTATAHWIAELVGADPNTVEAPGEPVFVTKASTPILRASVAGSEQNGGSGAARDPVSAATGTPEPDQELVSENELAKETGRGTLSHAAPEDTLALERPVPVAFATPSTNRPTIEAPRAVGISRTLPPVVNKPPLPGPPSGVPNPGEPGPAGPIAPGVPPETPGLLNQVLTTVKDAAKDVAEWTPVEEPAIELTESVPSPPVDVVAPPVTTADFISRLQSGGRIEGGGGGRPTERPEQAGLIERPLVQRLETGVSTVDRPLARVETAVTRIERPLANTLTRIERPVVERPVERIVERPVVERPVERVVERPIVERPIERIVKPLIERPLKLETGILR